MSWVEVLLVFLTNLKVVAMIAACGLAVMIFVLWGPVEDPKRAKPLVKWLVITTLLGCVPSVNELWKVRIGVIKLQLAGPENIQKGADVIERLGHKLECKYLGCEEEKKE